MRASGDDVDVDESGDGVVDELLRSSFDVGDEVDEGDDTFAAAAALYTIEIVCALPFAEIFLYSEFICCIFSSLLLSLMHTMPLITNFILINKYL